MSTQLMAGKRGLIMGLANDKSIAWGIAKACAEHGAELAFSYQGEQLKKRVEPLAQSVGSDVVLECDVADEASIDGLFAEQLNLQIAVVGHVANHRHDVLAHLLHPRQWYGRLTLRSPPESDHWPPMPPWLWHANT